MENQPVRDTQGLKNIENIVVPFSDGSKQIQVTSNLKKAFDTKGKELVKEIIEVANKTCLL